LRDLGQPAEELAAALLEEGLRQREFPGIHFRDTDPGRRAFVPGLRVPIYFLALLAREVRSDIATIAEHYSITADDVAVSLDYIRSHADEIEREITEHEAAEEQLLATLPPNQVVLIP
jgi:hypothetical protein